jgi:hypothetical protein
VELTEAQQDRYSRHLLLPGFGGEGQERLLEACVRVRGAGQAALWAARYLAASGVGRLILEGPAAAECGAINPDVRVLSASEGAPGGGDEQSGGEERNGRDERSEDLLIDLEGGGPIEGARAALDAVARLCGARK